MFLNVWLGTAGLAPASPGLEPGMLATTPCPQITGIPGIEPRPPV